MTTFIGGTTFPAVSGTLYTIADVLEETREVLQDQDPNNVRYPTMNLVRYVNDAVLQARRLRPDLFVYNYGSGLTPGAGNITLTPINLTPDSAYLTVPFPLPDIYFLAVVNFVIGRAEIRDDEFALDGRAYTFMQSYASALQGKA